MVFEKVLAPVIVCAVFIVTSFPTNVSTYNLLAIWLSSNGAIDVLGMLLKSAVPPISTSNKFILP